MTKSAEKRKQILEFLRWRDGDDCGICNQPMDFNNLKEITVDHKKPIAFGGADANFNRRLAHLKCNAERGCEHDKQILVMKKFMDSLYWNERRISENKRKKK